jgi:chromate transporter
MIMALRRELVERLATLSADQFGLSFMLARVTPGTNILAFCAATGYQMRRWPGALLAVLAVAIPSSVIAVVVSSAYQRWIENPLGSAVIGATLAAAVGLMLAGAWQLIRPHLRRVAVLRTTTLLAVSLLLASWAGWSPLQVIGAAAVGGALWRERDPQ